MRSCKIEISVFICLLTVVSTSLGSNLSLIFTTSQVLAQTNSDRKAEADRLLNEGFDYRRFGKVELALKSHGQALQIYREIKDRRGEARALLAFGDVYINLGNYPKGIEYFQQSLAIIRSIKKPDIEFWILSYLGAAYSGLGNYPQAIEYAEQSLIISRQLKNKQMEGNALQDLGIVYSKLGDYLKAIDYVEQGLKIAREVKNNLEEGSALQELGEIYWYEGDYPKAIEYFQQGLKIFRLLKRPYAELSALNGLGRAYWKQGNYSQAVEYLTQGLRISREFKDRRGEGADLLTLGNVYSEQENYPKAIDYLQQSLLITEETNDLSRKGKILNNLGHIFYKQGNLALAERTLIESLKVKESIRDSKLGDNQKVSLYETQRNTYNTLQKVLIAQNKNDAALEIAERSRSRAFVELLSSRLSTNKNLEKSPQSPTIAQMKQTAKVQNATLVQYSIIADDFKVTDKFRTEESELYIWVIKPTGEVIFRKADLKPLWQKENTNLDNLIATSRQSIGVRSRGIQVSYKPNLSKAQNNFNRLHELLIDPIADLLPTKENDKVIFIPQNSLFLVPFPALQDKNGKYLIEKNTILTSPSIQVLDLTHQQRQNIEQRNSTSPLIVGNPTMPKVAFKIGSTPQQLTSLPGAEKEAKAIASLFNTQALIGNKATEAAIVKRLPQAGIIHFATHGLFDDIRGLDSAIAFAPSKGKLTLTPENLSSLSSPLSKQDKKDDGLLTAEEILDLKINADLVVLSACDTGRGRITGDGVIGLSRSLISAGTPSVIVSLWAVDDGSTAFLMTKFYQNLQQKLDKATALRNAILAAKKKYASPSQWAAFTLIGESQ
ncbi:CHAT domain-containing tetratricopeptide repeat protein [Nostoc sp. ChiQUE01b]|uniref:CHAT domain-containing protein n=1 Tax=Nostoc sp. ChiQUE01b TaxID=3075376 RepID=UPI002AD56845|nr:CHAT domain-containing tetratricopeptide repeat protein [Nostoc sp. ChiQUE01b]MDZ8263442.1 CHAT domain-containing tetratricopeptide repeat protein [Nostoc sp. ChiQUE01b]